MPEGSTTHKEQANRVRRTLPRLSCIDPMELRSIEHLEGALIDPAAYTYLGADEDTLFELLRDLGEEHSSIPFTVLLRYHPADRDGAFLHTQARALFRAAVYGRFSLLLGGILSNADVRQAMNEIHSAFCLLELEGREFNGYISKGILIDTPLSLGITDTDGIDFICLDVSNLSRLFTGLSHAEFCSRKDPTLSDRVLNSTNTFLSNLSRTGRRELGKTARLTESNPREETLRWLKDQKFREIFLPANTIERARTLLPEHNAPDDPYTEKRR